jgi:hypothetical protein
MGTQQSFPANMLFSQADELSLPQVTPGSPQVPVDRF